MVLCRNAKGKVVSAPLSRTGTRLEVFLWRRSRGAALPLLVVATRGIFGLRLGFFGGALDGALGRGKMRGGWGRRKEERVLAETHVARMDLA